MPDFKLVSPFSPMGDQITAIEQLLDGIKAGKKEQVLLGGTGTGKTFTVSNVIAAAKKPTLVLAHNKTLAGQLYSELKEFFPENRVEYFISNYNIDSDKVYANGYSGGGETMSLVMAKRPELFSAYLHCSSRWDGDYELVVQNRVPVYFVIGADDEYYGSSPTREAYQQLHDLYQQAGLSNQEIDQLLVLDIKDEQYFSSQGVTYQHAGGNLFAHDNDIMGWLFSH